MNRSEVQRLQPVNVVTPSLSAGLEFGDISVCVVVTAAAREVHLPNSRAFCGKHVSMKLN